MRPFSFLLREFFLEGLRRRVPGFPLGICRITIGLMWLGAASWKAPPDFGQMTDSGLWAWTMQALQHPTVSFYQLWLERVVLPNFSFFGYLLLILELYVGVSLLLGLFTRLPSAVGFLLSLNLLLALSGVPGECPWTYIMMILFHFTFVVSSPGQNWGLDQIWMENMANWPDSTSKLKRFLLRLI